MHIQILAFNRENMKFTGITNSLICITAMFLCIELCSCFFLNRSQHDVYDLLDGQNCFSESVRLGDSQRCKCNERTTIASKPKHHGNIECLEGNNIEGGKNANLPYHLI